MAFLCIDIGGTNTLAGVGNGDFEVVEKVKSRKFVEDIEASLDSVLEQTGYTRSEIEEVAVAAAGPMDREEGLFFPPNMKRDEVQLRAPLEKFGDVMIINDCTSAVIGEYVYGDKSAENMVYVTISSGIGAGVILDGEVAEGWEGNFGEVGHMKLGGGLECGCGGEGHWEAYCSGNNIVEMAHELFEYEAEDSREIFEAFRDGDGRAEKVIDKFKQMNCLAVTNLVNIYNPEKILFGGAVPLNHPEPVVEPLKNDLEESVNQHPEIAICDLDDKSVIHGLRAACNGKFSP